MFRNIREIKCTIHLRTLTFAFFALASFSAGALDICDPLIKIGDPSTLSTADRLEALRYNPHAQELGQYGAIRALTLNEQPQIEFKPSVGMTVQNRDAEGNVTSATISLLTKNSGAQVFFVSYPTDHPEGIRTRLSYSDGYHRGTVPITHKTEYDIHIEYSDGSKHVLFDPHGELFNSPEYLLSQGLPADHPLRNIFWDFEHPKHYKRTQSPPDLRGKPIVIEEQEAHALIDKWGGGSTPVIETFRKIGESGVIEELKNSGINAIEFLPLTAGMDPNSWQWRYTIIGDYALNTRYGTPDEFNQMMDKLNEAGIGAILDVVPAHYAKQDATNHGPGNQGERSVSKKGQQQWKKDDGKALYGEKETRWKTFYNEFDDPEVSKVKREAIISMIKKYGFSGIRIDCIDCFYWYGPNGVQFLKDLVRDVEMYAPKTFILGESYYAKRDLLTTQQTDPVKGIGMHSRIDWEMFHIFEEKIQGDPSEINMFKDVRDPIRNKMNLGPLTVHYETHHDEATKHPEFQQKGASGGYVETLLGADSPEDRLAKTKAYSALMTLSGTFDFSMSQMRLRQQGDFTTNTSVEWERMKQTGPGHLYRFMGDLYKLKTGNMAFAPQNFHPDVEFHVDDFNKIIVLKRKDFKTGEVIFSVINLGKNQISNYQFGIDEGDRFEPVLQSSLPEYGGNGTKIMGTLEAENITTYEKPKRLTLPSLNPFEVIVLSNLLHR